MAGKDSKVQSLLLWNAGNGNALFQTFGFFSPKFLIHTHPMLAFWQLADLHQEAGVWERHHDANRLIGRWVCLVQVYSPSILRRVSKSQMPRKVWHFSLGPSRLSSWRPLWQFHCCLQVLSSSSSCIVQLFPSSKLNGMVKVQQRVIR